jgi:endonuclease YncB( thermonuclease family)
MLVLSATALAFCGATGGGAAADLPECRLEATMVRTAVRVIDGETLVLDDGGEVRLVGAMSPRASDVAAEHAVLPLEGRAKRELEAVVLGRSVALAFDGRRSDRYGRLLAQVFVGTASPRVWVQGHMLKRGLARVASMPGSVACLDALAAQERVAREAGAGLWSEAVYQIRSADRTAELLRYRSTFQIVEGRVVSASERSGRIFLNFGQDWQADFTAGLDAPVARLATASGLDVMGLGGRHVRVRGWIERRGGPYVAVHHPHQIELLPEGGGMSRAGVSAPQK